MTNTAAADRPVIVLDPGHGGVDGGAFGVGGAIEKALAIDNTVIMDFVVEKEENVFPMVPAGEAINKMLGGGLA